LTPYQFASNTPIQAVDLDGLEMYFAADGKFVGRSGTSTEIRIITNKDAVETARNNLKSQRNNHKWLLDPYHSSKAHTNEDTPLIEWAQKVPNMRSDREQTLSLFQHSIEMPDGSNQDVLLEGSTFESPYQRSAVNPEGSKLVIKGVDYQNEYGWKRAHVIHSHPGHDDSPLSFGSLSGDVNYSIESGLPIYLVTRGHDYIRKFDPSIFGELMRSNGSRITRQKAAEESVDKKLRWSFSNRCRYCDDLPDIEPGY
jgi:hypothetical protein